MAGDLSSPVPQKAPYVAPSNSSLLVPDPFGPHGGRNPMTSRLNSPLFTAGLYLVVGLLWVLVTDRLLAGMTDDPGRLASAQTVKGWLFVGLSTAFVAVLTTQHRRVQRRGEQLVRTEVEASEARFRSLVQNSSDVITVVNDDFEVGYQSSSLKAVLGWDPDSSHAFWDRIHPDDVDRLRTEFREELRKGSAVAVYRARHADGSWRWLESVGVDMLDDPAVQAYVINTRDVTERHGVEEQLLAEKGFTESLIDGLPGVFYVLDEEGRLIRWNRNFSTVLGYEEADLLGSDPFDLFTPEERDGVARAARQVFIDGSATTQATFITASGERLPYSLSGKRIEMPSGPLLVGMGIDISRQVQAQVHINELNRQLQQRLDYLTALREIDNAIVGSIGLDKVLDTALTQLSEKLKVDGCCVLLYNPSLRRLRFGASVGLIGRAHRGTYLRLGEGAAGRAAQSREQVVLTGAEQLKNELAPARDLSNEGFEFYVATPLIAKGQLLGVLEVFQRVNEPHAADWYDFLTALTAQAAIALENANLVESLHRTNFELTSAYERTIEGWSAALDLRDKETEGHSRRVTEQTVLLAERLGVPNEQLVHVRRGALLHDIGKMGVPDSVLLKPGPLDDEEWALMKRHPELAYQLLQPIGFMRAALDIPYCHHERWDGSGYPRGLKGEEIPFSARIFAVVDVYDALTSERPYRAAWTRERALSHISALSGVHFDPQVVDEFMAMMVEEQHVWA